MTSFKSQLHLMRRERTADFTQGTFPNPESLGGRAVGWLEAEINNGYSDELKKRAAKSRCESMRVAPCPISTAFRFLR